MFPRQDQTYFTPYLDTHYKGKGQQEANLRVALLEREAEYGRLKHG
jgi:hypothetical protein